MTCTTAPSPVFLAQGQIDVIPALILAIGFTVGGSLGAHVAVRGGERVIRAVMVVAALALAARLLGLFG